MFKLLDFRVFLLCFHAVLVYLCRFSAQTSQKVTAPMNFKKFESETKLRGGYYTPSPVADFLSRWVLEKRPSLVLEPSCGDGSFVGAIARNAEEALLFQGVEIDPKEAGMAQEALAASPLLEGNVVVEDFLKWSLAKMDEGYVCDAVLGNPPYVRYQYLEKDTQALSEKIFSRFNLKFTKHTNIWVPFIIASIALLKKKGRLGMVVPSEIMHVLHATSLRHFLLENCSRILMIDPNELLFVKALQGTVLLMVEKKNGESRSDGVAVHPAQNNSFLENDPCDYFDEANYVNGEHLNGKWMKVLLSPEELELFERVKKNRHVKKFKDIASADVGIVTGANKFFLIDDTTVESYKLHKWATPMFGRSEHVSGVIYNKNQHMRNKKDGHPTNFLWFDGTQKAALPKEVQSYIDQGEKELLHERYKCRIRSPWYKVPSVYSTDIGMLKRSHNFPRLIFNSLGALTTDTAYRIESSSVPARKLVYCFMNSFTALTAELEGRHYGGGVLELVPSEIEKLLVPIPEDIRFDLRSLDKRVRESKDPESLFREQDKSILIACGLTERECKIIQGAWKRVRSRRQRHI